MSKKDKYNVTDPPSLFFPAVFVVLLCFIVIVTIIYHIIYSGLMDCYELGYDFYKPLESKGGYATCCNKTMDGNQILEFKCYKVKTREFGG